VGPARNSPQSGVLRKGDRKNIQGCVGVGRELGVLSLHSHPPFLQMKKLTPLFFSLLFGLTLSTGNYMPKTGAAPLGAGYLALPASRPEEETAPNNAPIRRRRIMRCAMYM
jgi:hypothetical protein